MHLPSCPSDTQWSAAAGGREAASARSGNASSLIATTVTSWPAPRAASSTRNGNRPFPAIRPKRTLVLGPWSLGLGPPFVLGTSLVLGPLSIVSPRRAANQGPRTKAGQGPSTDEGQRPKD